MSEEKKGLSREEVARRLLGLMEEVEKRREWGFIPVLNRTTIGAFRLNAGVPLFIGGKYEMSLLRPTGNAGQHLRNANRGPGDAE